METIFVYGFLPLGVLLTLFLLSNISVLERCAIEFHKRSQFKVERLTVSLTSVITLASAYMVIHEQLKINRLNETASRESPMGWSKGSLVRAKADFWYGVSVFIVWLIYWRLVGMISKFSAEVEENT